MPVLSTVYVENRKEPYGIKSYIFLYINNQKGHLLLYNYVTHKTHTHMKEGVLNEKLALKKLLTYITSVYKIQQKIKCLSDKRKRKSIPLFNIVMPVLLFLMLQYESFHTVFSAPESMSKRLRNCINGKIPKIDAVRDLVSGIDPEEVRKIHEETIDTLKKNRVFWKGTIGGHVVAGIDGVELFSSTKNPARTVLPGKTVQVKRNISIGVWSV